MKVKESTVRKACSFYVSNMHFATMILPFASKQMADNTKIVTFFENSYTTNIELVLSKLTLKEETKKKLLEIDWKDTKEIKYAEIEKILKNKLEKRGKNLIIINGSEQYINIINGCIDRYIEKTYKKYTENPIQIINFYEMRNI